MIVNCILFFIISSATVFLFFISSLSAVSENIPLFLLFIIMNIGLIYSVAEEFMSMRKCEKFRIYYKDIFFSIAGGLFTYILNIYLLQGPVISASLTGIIGSSFFPKYSVPMYAGAVAGMISPAVNHNPVYMLMVLILTGTMYAFLKNTYSGVGGKLGASSFSAWFIFYYIFNINLLNNPYEEENFLILLIIPLIGLFSTFILQHYFKREIVASSSVISLLGALIFPVIFKNSSQNFSAVLMAATFAGMSSKDRIKNIYEIFIIAVFISVSFIYSYTHFGGSGGKLGALAFGSVLSEIGLKKLIKNIIFSKKRNAV